SDLPWAQRYSIATVSPSLQPSSRKRAVKATVHGPHTVASAPSTPMSRWLPGCCASAASGHAPTKPQTIFMNSRRSMASLHHEGHFRLSEEYQTAALALCPLSQRGQCPLWVKSGHGSAFTRCPLYPQKRTWFSAVVMSALCQKRTLLLITSSAVARADAAWPGVYGRHRLKIKEGSRGGLRSLAPLLRRANIVQAQRRSDESKMRECLREIAKLPLRLRIVFFRKQTNIVAQREETLEEGA